jgi:hypothetical protein
MGKALMCHSLGILFKFMIFAVLITATVSNNYLKSKNEPVDKTSYRFDYFTKKCEEKFIIHNPSIDRCYLPAEQIYYFIQSKVKENHFLIKTKKSINPLWGIMVSRGKGIDIAIFLTLMIGYV